MLFRLFEGRLINIERYDWQIYMKLPVATLESKILEFRHADRQTDNQTDRQTDRKTEGQTWR